MVKLLFTMCLFQIQVRLQWVLTYKDFLGDRVAEVRVLEPGLFKDERELENVDLDINFDFPKHFD
jgi:hypothetical protein